MLPPNVMPLRSVNGLPGPMSASREVYYIQPTLDELMGLCRDFGLISDVQAIGGRYIIQCKEERFDVSDTEASYLVRGLLIGHFAFHTRDDLSLANWTH